MNLRVLPLIAMGGTMLLASCTAGPYVEAPPSARAQQQLAAALAGRTAGPAVRCLPSHRATQMDIIDRRMTLYREGRTIYAQNFRGGCPGIGTGRYTMVTRQFGTNRLCDGDISRLVDLSTGMEGGSCVFGPFVPYTKL